MGILLLSVLMLIHMNSPSHLTKKAKKFLTPSALQLLIMVAKSK